MIESGSLWVSKEYRNVELKEGHSLADVLATWPRVEVCGPVQIWSAVRWSAGVSYMSGDVLCAMPEAVFLRLFEQVVE